MRVSFPTPKEGLLRVRRELLVYTFGVTSEKFKTKKGGLKILVRCPKSKFRSKKLIETRINVRKTIYLLVINNKI